MVLLLCKMLMSVTLSVLQSFLFNMNKYLHILSCSSPPFHSIPPPSPTTNIDVGCWHCCKPGNVYFLITSKHRTEEGILAVFVPCHLCEIIKKNHNGQYVEQCFIMHYFFKSSIVQNHIFLWTVLCVSITSKAFFISYLMLYLHGKYLII